jgi:aminopeptidase
VEIPKWFVDSKNYLVEKGYCYVAISAEDPLAFLGVDENRLSAVSKAKSIALKKFSENVMKNGIRWCVVSVPTPNWAKLVFKDSENPEKDLADAIEKAMRLDTKNPLLSWQDHIANLDRRASFLNQNNFEYLHFKSKNGTDLKVGLANNHVWLSAKEKAMDGIDFVANMPTEEIFTAPHRLKVDGVVKSTKPLSFNGNLIEDFSMTFKNGKIVDYSAKKGYLTLKGIIETDTGTRRIGEVALIGKNSPIAKSRVLFYNTLFDENASCHLALGSGYPTTVKNGGNLTKKELLSLGVNDSIEHVDFMIGDLDTEIYGIKNNGEKVLIFDNGDWVI